MDSDLGPPEIGPWTEIKLEILRKYASAYSRILSTRTEPSFTHIYIDGFAGSGAYAAKGTGNLVWGSPTSVLLVDPPFREYHLIDLDRGNIEVLEEMVSFREIGPYRPEDVFFYNGDCNEVLLKEVFPRARYEDYRRGLCLLDPYGLHLNWGVVQTAGQMRSIELFINFPIMDMNRNVLLRNPDKARPDQIDRMNSYWGDRSWEEAAYSRNNLFRIRQKTTNEDVVNAYLGRLRTAAGFHHVPDPLPMKNTRGAVVYYLIFAAHQPVAGDIVREIFDQYRI
jgi:three-Cys-motif partner protein